MLVPWTRELACGGSEKYMGSGYILKIEPTGFAERKDMEYEKERENSQE